MKVIYEIKNGEMKYVGTSSKRAAIDAINDALGMTLMGQTATLSHMTDAVVRDIMTDEKITVKVYATNDYNGHYTIRKSNG